MGKHPRPRPRKRRGERKPWATYFIEYAFRGRAAAEMDSRAGRRCHCTLVSRLQAKRKPLRDAGGRLGHVQALARRRGRLAQVFTSSLFVFVCPKGGGGAADGAYVSCDLSSSTHTWHVRPNLQPSASMWSLRCCTLVVGPICIYIHILRCCSCEV